MAASLTVICWKWRAAGYRHAFTAAHVEILRAMVARHYARPHRFVCITDDPAGLTCETLPLWDDFSGLRNASGDHLPSCYRRLKMFAPGMAALLGPRAVSLDLDCAIVGDLVPLWDRPEPIVAWTPRVKRRPMQINGSMILFTPGSHSRLWESFDPARSPRLASAQGFIGSDQGWISHCLRGAFASWTTQDGVHRYGDLRTTRLAPIPDGARIVFFTGPRKPWDAATQKEAPWVREHWCGESPRRADSRRTGEHPGLVGRPDASRPESKAVA